MVSHRCFLEKDKPINCGSRVALECSVNITDFLQKEPIIIEYNSESLDTLLVVIQALSGGLFVTILLVRDRPCGDVSVVDTELYPVEDN